MLDKNTDRVRLQRDPQGDLWIPLGRPHHGGISTQSRLLLADDEGGLSTIRLQLPAVSGP
ncbi:hypothetical protein CR513_00724, partial [Mucuna pruriens]